MEILALLVLVAAYLYIRTWRGEWLPNFQSDEPMYVDLAIRCYQGGGTTPIAFSPLYHDIITPFVAIFFPKETGFVIWKFIIYTITTGLVYINLRLVAPLWIGLLFSLHFLMLNMYMPLGTYMVLAMSLLLLCSYLVAKSRDNLGFAAGVMLLGVHVRGEFQVILMAFLALCLIFERPALLSKRFAARFVPFCVLFVGIIFYHGSDFSHYYKMFKLRGGFAYHHYVATTLLDEGYFKEFPEVKSRGDLDMVKHVDPVYKKLFGMSETEFRERAGFDLIDMYKAQPELMKAHYQRIFRESLKTIPGAFLIDLPLGDAYDPHRPPPGRGLYWFRLGVIAGLPAFIWGCLRRRRGDDVAVDFAWPPRIFWLCVLSQFAAFVPWYMSMPAEHYVVMITPAAYLCGAGMLVGVVRTLISRCRFRTAAQGENAPAPAPFAGEPRHSADAGAAGNPH